MDNNEGEIRYRAAEQFCAAAEKEYEYERARNANLDNKINMTLAFCGVIFAFLFEYLDFRVLFAASHTCAIAPCYECVLRFICILSRALCLVCFARCIYILFRAVSPRTYFAIDTNDLLDYKINELDQNQAYMYLGYKYTEITNENHKENEKRAACYGKSVNWLLFSISFCALSQMIEVNFL